MRLDPLSQRGIHSSLPAWARGLELSQHIRFKPDRDPLAHHVSFRAATPDKLGAFVLIGTLKESVCEFWRVVRIKPDEELKHVNGIRI
jgi:hypothetical protein